MTNPKKTYFKVANAETGELMDYTLPSDFSNENYEIRNRKQLKKQRQIFSNYNNPFSFAHMENIENMLQENKLSLTTLGSLLVLTCYINSNDTMISKRKDKIHPPYTRKEIQELLNLKDTTFKTFLRESISANILTTEGDKRNLKYYFNKDYHFKGIISKSIARKTVRIYKNGILSLFEENKLKLDQIGFLYLLIPYVSYEDCTLVRYCNQEPTLENSLNIKELSELLGLDMRTVNKYLKLKFNYTYKDGTFLVPAFGGFFIMDSNKKVYCINPALYRRTQEQRGNIAYNSLEKCFKKYATKVDIR